jgi:tape measure domain-containing protein
MAVSDLNVRIAVYFREFDRSMRQVERRMMQTSEKLRSIADDMSMSITLPLIGVGAAAIKAAGDFETLDKALSTTMRNAGYTTQQATEELEKLRQIALAPGIDLEQAVKGSIRLQSVGFSAERARVTIAELANALAASGGSADQLDSVTRQFSQMSSKGRILQEDLSVILENMPGLAKTIKDTFGTISADALRDAGVSADEFIDKITQGLAKTERVQGGIANAVNNAQSALKQFFATIGNEINKVYNINEIADAFSETLGKVAEYFRLLEPETKKSIINYALYAAAIGPAIKVMQLFYSGGVALISGIRFIAAGLKNLSGVTLNAVAALQKMTVAQKALAAGTVIGAIALLAGAFVLLSDKIKTANTAYATLSEIRAKANEQVSTERAAIIPLIAILKDENATRDEKAKALGRLQEISPKYFASLDVEKLSIAELTKLQDQYIESLLRAARVKAAEEKLIELDKERIRLEELKLRLTQKSTVAFQQMTGGFGSYTAYTEGSANSRKQFIEDTERSLQSIKNQTDAVTGLIRANLDLPQTTNNVKNATGDLNKVTDANTESTLKSAKAIKEQKDRYQELFDLMDETEARAIKLEAATRAYYDAIAIQRFQGNFGADPTAPSEGDIMSAFPQADQQTPGISFTNEQLSSLDELREKLKLTREEQEAFTYSTGNFFAMWKDGGEAQKAMTDSVLNSIQSLNSQGSASFQEYAAAAVSSALQVAKSMAIEGIFKAVSSAMKLPFPANIAAGALAAGAASALFNGLQSKIQPPKLAQGGLAYGPTLAMVGDNRMAGIDPEVIAPLSKLQDMLGGSQRVEVMGKISGRDLMLVMNKEVESTNRYR